jgi:ABC-type Mn2+/Zn2+ transport system ATPase subunit
LININNISLSFADRKIFDGITWLIPEKSRIGLVGDNGTGKTTLLKAIIGMVDLDEGAIEIPNRKNRNKPVRFRFTSSLHFVFSPLTYKAGCYKNFSHKRKFI